MQAKFCIESDKADKATRGKAAVIDLDAWQIIREYEPAGKGADEIKRLYQWICKHMDM